MSESYENDMVRAFVGKPNKPKKEQWYMNTFAKMDENMKANNTISWKWSWWSFFLGSFFLLYRKAYIAAFLYVGVFVLTHIVFIGWSNIIGWLNIIGWINPIAAVLIINIPLLLYMILSGGFGMHFVHKTYLKKRKKIEEKFLDDYSRVEVMKIIGGYNQWVIWLLLLPYFIFFIAGVFSVGSYSYTP